MAGTVSRTTGWPRWALALATMLGLAACSPPVAHLGSGHALKVWRAASVPQPAGPAAVAPGLDAQELVRRALEHDPALRALRAEVASIEAGVGLARERGELEVRLSQFRLDDVRERRAGVELAVRARPVRPREVPANIATARLEADAARAELREAEILLAGEIRRLHADLRIAEDEAAIAQDELALRDEERAIVASRLAAGAGTALDVALSQLSSAELAADAAAPVDASNPQLRRLRTHLGLAPDAPMDLTGAPGGVDAPAAEAMVAEAMIAEALAQHPLVNRAEAQLAGAAVEAWRAPADAWPWFSFVQVDYDAVPQPNASSESKPYRFGFALGINIPLWQWSGASVRAARAQQVHRQLAFEATVFEVAAEVQVALAEVRVARERLATIESVLLPAAQVAADEARKARAQSALDPMRALQLQNARLKARRLHAAARRELAHALIGLDEVLGRRP
ncbi:MAG: TolC family protein [Myxococcota bacterium]